MKSYKGAKVLNYNPNPLEILEINIDDYYLEMDRIMNLPRKMK